MDQTTWNKLVLDNAPAFGAFLQSWEWGEFQRTLGRTIERIDHVGAEGRTIAQVIRMPIPFGKRYWYAPKGPLGKAPIEKQIEVLREGLSGGIFLRIEPREASTMMHTGDIQPSTTLMLDLTKGNEQLLSEMKSKTRYNLRLASRKGVVCRIVGLEHFDDFIRLMNQTAKRDGFAPHPAGYYRKMLEELSGGDVQAFIAMGFFEERPVVGNIMIDFGGVRTYLHGASSNLHRNVMAPYALHGFLIEDAIRKGLKAFDFWGIAPTGAGEDHPWAGITRYKEGFGGTVVSMPGTFDLPMQHLWYSFYKFAKRVRSIR